MEDHSRDQWLSVRRNIFLHLLYSCYSFVAQHDADEAIENDKNIFWVQSRTLSAFNWLVFPKTDYLFQNFSEYLWL